MRVGELSPAGGNEGDEGVCGVTVGAIGRKRKRLQGVARDKALCCSCFKARYLLLCINKMIMSNHLNLYVVSIDITYTADGVGCIIRMNPNKEPQRP